jgi:plastocyanin
VLIFGIMLPPFRRLSGYYSIAFIHGILGSAAEVLGLYVVLVATRLLPQPLRFSNYNPWMRTALVLWWITILFGLGTYYMLYLKPERVVATAVTATTVRVTNFAVEPRELTVPAGTTVEWIDETGQHNVLSEGGSFKSDDLTAGGRFTHQFNEPGTFPYYCEFHGESGGKKMAGVIIVKPK